jgi:glucose/arabinose dehydrogenase
MTIQKTWTGLLATPFFLLACGGGGDNNNNNGKTNFPCVAATPVAGTTVQLQSIATGLENPVYVTGPEGDTRLFIVEQAGRIRLVKNGLLLAAAYLDINDRVNDNAQERGLLSVAFHPDFVNNGKLYVYYTDAGGDIQISEFTTADSNGDTADATTEKKLLFIEHTANNNHNGGLLKFGPDGFLYAGVGDGGSAGDPFDAGQNTTNLLGKLLRIDSATGAPAPGNPFGNEVYDFGLRNPWRYSFDRETGDLYIADVGQNQFEEVNFKTAATPPGTNWGWRRMEGNGHCFNPADNSCNDPALNITLPITEYQHINDPDGDNGCSITGGYVYRGDTMPDLAGTYFFADVCASFVKSLKVVGGVATNEQDVTAQFGGAQAIVSFGEDGCGENYVVELGGTVSKMVPGQ